ncbi:RT0821/Lpp0805 family surface protein [Niveispirillum sp. BGYR6]|uniref:RT0821/Lpp0805 family surface protein n=1 Tax=Niveispirillum sp. BGYR6 TaxID=2971249 RepID=UPI0022B94313|nr:RT0821/Lpp0805 family surface protein [Niveispirillum sp. BGYR6]MDG5494644.1 RT0821/Lpp0805 family surface protein [Niveispirillum sp. BGYR6]
MRIRPFTAIAATAGLVLSLVVPPSFAHPGDDDRGWGWHGHHDDDRDWHRDRDWHGDHDWHGPDRRRDVYVHEDVHIYRPGPPPGPPPGWWEHERRPVVNYYIPPERRRVYRDVVVVRPYGHWYNGYGHYRRDDDALLWLGLTGITLAMLNNINENQQRALEDAQIRATAAPIGQPIYWSDSGANGQVVAVREGRTATGSYCREFQQTVMIGGRAEDAYGTACRMPDGAWQVVNDQQ